MNRKVLKVAALMCSVCIAAAGCGSKKSDETALRKVNVTEFTGRDMSKTLKVEGVVESTENDSTIMTDNVSLKVKKINVSVGDAVKAGDILCELDSTELEKEIADLEKRIADTGTLNDLKYQQLQKELENTRKSGNLSIQDASDRLDEARRNYNSAKSSYDENRNRYNGLVEEANNLKNEASGCEDPEQAAMLMQQYQVKMGEAQQAMSVYESASQTMQTLSGTISAYENALEAAKLSAGNQIDTAQFSIDSYNLTSGSDSETQNRLDELKRNLENTKIKATRDGVVSAVKAEEGKVCREGVLMTVQNASNICVHVVISEEDLLSVKSGMKAEIKIPARKDEKYSGSVERILDIKTGNGFDCYINIDKTDDFRIGMTSKVEITTVDASDVLAVPQKSIVADKDDETKFYVYEAEKQSDDTYKLRKVEVTKGEETEKYAAVSGEGLEKGDYIVNIPGRCSEGDIVDIRTGGEKND